MPYASERPAAQLLSANLRVTAIRMAVLDAVASMPHVEVQRVVDSVSTRLGGVSRQSVYDTLATLASAGLVRRIEPAGSVARYETRVGDNHHHVVCRSCGAAVDVDCAVGSAPCLDPVDAHGFILDEAEVTYWGICPECRSRSSVEEVA